MKARLDYIKMQALVDLKSFSNMQSKPVQRAIDMAIATRKYYIPVVVYLEAIAAAKAMMVKRGQGCVCSYKPFESGEWHKVGVSAAAGAMPSGAGNGRTSLSRRCCSYSSRRVWPRSLVAASCPPPRRA